LSGAQLPPAAWLNGHAGAGVEELPWGTATHPTCSAHIATSDNNALVMIGSLWSVAAI
jgi:hypothetical protein